jgi:TnpA family transposase
MNTGYKNERIAYPQLPDPISADVLKALYTPWRDEITWAFEVARSEETRLRLLVLLKIFDALGRFVAVKDIPPEIIRHIANRADLVERDHLVYSKRTLVRHYRLIREFLGVTEWGTDAIKVAETTMEQIAASRTQPADLINGAIEVLIREHFELPALSTLRRMAGIVQQRTNDGLFDVVANHLTAAHRDTLDVLLEVPKDAKESPFAKLCRPPGRATAKNLKALAGYLDWLENLAIPQVALADIMPVKIGQWADEARRMIATELKEYRAPRRHALLLALIYVSRGSILDDQVKMLIKSMRKIQHQAQEDLQAWLDERQESSEQLIIILLDLARSHQTNGALGFHRQAAAIFATAGGSDQIVKRCEARLEHRVRDWRPFARKYFRNRRSALMDLAEVLPLKAMPGSQGVLDALNKIVSLRSYREEWIKVTPKLDESFLRRGWHKQVCDLDEPGVYNRRFLEVAVFFELAEALQSGEIYVPGSCNYDTYTDRLYPIESDPEAVSAYLNERGLSGNAEAFVTQLREWLDRHIRDLDTLVGELGIVQLNAEGRPIVPRPSANKPPDSALALEKLLHERLPRRTILEALYNTDQWTQWTRHFGPPARIAPQFDYPARRYVLTSFAYGCGLGPTQASHHFKEAVPVHLLAFANRRHISTDALRAACNDLINLYAEFGLPLCWGSGESAAADGSLLETYEENLFAAHHVRYRRSGGIAYRHVADTYIALFTHFIPCGVHEAIYILDGLLKNPSQVQPRRLHADTHGQSTTVFGLAYLLGIELMPRIRHWRSLTLYRTGTRGRPKYTQSLYSGTIDWGVIEAHWEDYLRVVLGIQSGRVSPSWVLARLNRYSRRNRLYLAFQELGRVVRTVYLLRWIADEALRAGVTDGANKVESFHEFSDFLNFGSRGVLKTNDPHEQEKLTVYNQLVANAVMLQNVVDQTRILHALHQEGYAINKEDLAFMSPYMTRNLNRFGVYPTRYKTDPALANKGLPI